MSRTASTPESETALLRRIAAKDRRAFEALYHAYYRRLFAYLFKTTRRPELAEEVLDDVMLAVWTGAAGFNGRSRPSFFCSWPAAQARACPLPRAWPRAPPVVLRSWSCSLPRLRPSSGATPRRWRRPTGGGLQQLHPGQGRGLRDQRGRAG